MLMKTIYVGEEGELGEALLRWKAVVVVMCSRPSVAERIVGVRKDEKTQGGGARELFPDPAHIGLFFR